MDKRTKDVMTDLIAMLAVYVEGKTNNDTRGQAIATLREAYKLMEEVKFVERREFLHKIMFRKHKENTNG